VGHEPLTPVQAGAPEGAIYRRREGNSSKYSFRYYLARRKRYFHKSIATDDLKETLRATEVLVDIRSKIITKEKIMSTTSRKVWALVVLVAGGLFLGALQPADAAPVNLVRNGSFEYNAQLGCRIGITVLHGWTVTAGNVDIGSANCYFMPAAVGEFWLDLTGSATQNDVGTIAQNVPTVVGKNYRLSFYFGGNPQCLDEAIKSMRVLLNGVVVGKYSINVTGVAADDAQWQKGIIIFAATTSPTVLSFQSLKGVNAFTVCGPLLDGVSVVAIQ
jgi:hypothetical protein